MNTASLGLLRLALIGGIALATMPAVPTASLAAGGGVDRCDGTALLGTARLGGGRGNLFAGNVTVDGSGTFRWACSTGAGVQNERTECGADGSRIRFITAELRGGVVYVDCW
ncbi:MAG: hypothetical protein IT534_04870 [Bauldia sp.]|nr:hypothetical protein [Bauldia sp.]